MQIHELTRKRPTNEGILAGIADVAGRSIMQKYGGTQGGSYNLGATASTAQGMAAKLSDPLVKQLATGIQQTFKTDVMNLIKNGRGPNNTPVTSASQLQMDDIKKALLGEVTKLVGFDFHKLPDTVDPTAGNNTGKNTAHLIVGSITKLIDAITAAEASGNPEALKQQNNYWLPLAQNIQSAKSMEQFNKAGGSDTPQTPLGQEIKKKAEAAGLTPTQLGLDPSLNNPKTQAMLQLMGFRK